MYTLERQGSDAGLFCVPAFLSNSPSSVGSIPGATLAGTLTEFTVEDFCFMPGTSKGSKNGNWKGGRTVTQDGYVLIRVGKDHPSCRFLQTRLRSATGNARKNTG